MILVAMEQELIGTEIKGYCKFDDAEYLAAQKRPKRGAAKPKDRIMSNDHLKRLAMARQYQNLVAEKIRAAKKERMLGFRRQSTSSAAFALPTTILIPT